MDIQDIDKIREKAQLHRLIGEALEAVALARLFASEANLLNSQEYINFEDELNAISVADPQ